MHVQKACVDAGVEQGKRIIWEQVTTGESDPKAEENVAPGLKRWRMPWCLSQKHNLLATFTWIVWIWLDFAISSKKPKAKERTLAQDLLLVTSSPAL